MTSEKITSSVRGLVTILSAGILALILVPTRHESGHAAVCLIDGVVGTQLQPFGAHPQTRCLPPTLTPIRIAAGSLTSVAARLLFTYVVNRAPRPIRGSFWNFIATLWFFWSFWLFCDELFGDALHAYADVSLQTDAGYFVHVTGINPLVASATVVARIALLSLPLVRVGGQIWKNSDLWA